jgi:phage shock protein PspC (stress-responsive transcriptional regulator)
MSNPYSTPPAPKVLRRSRSDRFVGGVCGGVANYLNMDATLVRILTVVITLFTGLPVVLYVVALFLMPEEDVEPRGAVYPPAPGTGYPPAPGTAQPPAEDVWGPAGPPWAGGNATPPKREDGPAA